jgi:hypothetical protein
MANCHFEISVPESPEDILATAKSAITKANGKFSGDTNSGHFSIPVGIGDIEGVYFLKDGKMVVDITKKPLLVGCKLIENQMRSYLKPYEA